VGQVAAVLAAAQVARARVAVRAWPVQEARMSRSHADLLHVALHWLLIRRRLISS